MKIKGPVVPPKTTSTQTQEKSKAEVKGKTEEVVNSLVAKLGGDDEAKRTERRGQLSSAERAKKLKAMAQKANLNAKDSPREATHKIVNSVLSDHYDPKERGFRGMVDGVTDFIQETNEDLKEKFDKWIDEMKTLVDPDGHGGGKGKQHSKADDVDQGDDE